MRRSSEQPDLNAVNPWVCGACQRRADGRDPLPRGWITLTQKGGDVPAQYACGWGCAALVADDLAGHGA